MTISRAYVCFALAAGFVSLAATAANALPPYPFLPEAIDLNHGLGKPIRHGNLTITPIYGFDDRDANYLTLDEALDQDVLKVEMSSLTGISQSAFIHVNATNLSAQPIFVMMGEIMLGGMHDIIVANSIVIGAKATVPLTVYSVNHNRGREDGGTFRPFRSSKKAVDARLRTAMQFPAVSTHAAHIRQDGKATKETSAYVEAIMTELRNVPSLSVMVPAPPDVSRSYDLAIVPMVGMVTSYGENIQSVEIFSSSQLFAKLSRKLVQSAALAAVDAPRTAQAGAAKSPTPASVSAFLADAKQAKADVTSKSNVGTSTIQLGKLTSKATVTADGREVYTSTQNIVRPNRVRN